MTLKAPPVTVTSAAQLNIRKLPPLSLDRKDFIFSHKVCQGPELPLQFNLFWHRLGSDG
jgi:hypothetical protein